MSPQKLLSDVLYCAEPGQHSFRVSSLQVIVIEGEADHYYCLRGQDIFKFKGDRFRLEWEPLEDYAPGEQGAYGAKGLGWNDF